jgi:predicted ATPase/DNA-binding SARP family transcriptional activator
MEIRLLGPVEVVADAGPVHIGSPKQRAVLAMLALDAEQVVATDTLIEGLWGEHPPGDSLRALRFHVSRLRQALGPERAALTTRPGGYRLTVGHGRVDAHRVDELVTAARSIRPHDPDGAASLFKDALAHWRGASLLDVLGEPFAPPVARRLDELRSTLEEERLEARLACGHHDAELPELERLADAEPLRERRWELLALALYRAGRQADALATCRRARHHLAQQRPADPPAALADLERRITAKDPSLLELGPSTGATAAAAALPDADLDAATATPGRPSDNRALPSGLVTFVLTDIESSTRLLRRLGDHYDDVLDRHITILRQAWEAHGGVQVSTNGDSCFAAFHDARAAVEACADAQRQLADEPWPGGDGPRVRMGIHTGMASPHRGDYVALAIHQVARVMAAAHGGQILVSDVTTAACGTPPGLSLVSLGRYRLRDFDGPAEVFGVAGSGLATDLPAVRALPVDGHNIGTPPTSLIGRDADVHEVLATIGPGRLVTLAGPGGVGKSRLALAAGLAAVGDWADGVWLVDLAPVQEPALVGDAVGAAVGATVSRGSDRWDEIIDHLEDRQALIVLDTCEHLADHLASHVTHLLETCPGVGVLATSREPLAVAGEFVIRVAPLAVPPVAANVDEAMASPAVQLFVERARRSNPAFTLTDENVDTVVLLCRRLDGLPLAVELAAAQTAVLHLTDVLAGLDDRLRVLQSRDRDVLDRQRTMEAVIGWSVRLLRRDEQLMLRRLGIFRDGFSLVAATIVAGDLDAPDAHGALWALVDKSLVALDPSANQTRYRLLETVRSYARGLLDDAGETVATAQRLTTWWLDRLGPWHRMDSTRSGEIEVELDNLRDLIPVVADAAQEQAQQLACTIGQYHRAVKSSRDPASELSRYARDLPTPSPARVSLLGTLAMLHDENGDIDAARAAVAEAEAIETITGPPSWDEVAVQRARGEVAIRTGDHQAAVELARQTLARGLNARSRVRMLNMLAIASYFAGDADQAEAATREELALATGLGDQHMMVVAEGNIAELAMGRGDVAAAVAHHRACLELALALGNLPSTAFTLIGTARLAASTDPGTAARLHARAEDLLAEVGHQLYDDDLRASQEMLDDVRRQLGDEGFLRASDDGRTLSLNDAASLARKSLGELV